MSFISTKCHRKIIWCSEDEMTNSPWHTKLPSSEAKDDCFCLHNYIRDSALRDQHFDMFEHGGYVMDDMPSPLGVDNTAPIDDGTMGTVRDYIAAGLVA